MVLVKKFCTKKGKRYGPYGPYQYNIRRVAGKVKAEYQGKTVEKSSSVVQEQKEEELPVIRCKDCCHIDDSTDPCFCFKLGFYLDKRLLNEPWQCSDFKKKEKERK